MKQLLFAFFIIAAVGGIMTSCQNKNDNTLALEKRITELEDRAAIKNLVDTFATLSDTKEAKLQSTLFTEDGTVKTYSDGQLAADLKGRKQIAEVFGNFLNTLQTVYHQSGQLTVTIDGNKATGVNYCQVTMIGEFNGTKTITMQGVRYNDEYEKINGRWYIKNRVSNFMWRDVRPMQ